MTSCNKATVSKWFRIPLMILCISIAVFAGYDTGGEPTGDESREIVALRGSRGVNSFKIKSLSERFEYFDEFIVYVRGKPRASNRDRKDAGGDGRILVCSVALQLCRGMKLTKERVLLRKIIYEQLQELPPAGGVGKRQKARIKDKLNAFMGNAIVKNVYFTRFVLL